MDATRRVDVELPNITSERARDARARAWAYVFNLWHAKKGEQHVVTTINPMNTESMNTNYGTGEN